MRLLDNIIINTHTTGGVDDFHQTHSASSLALSQVRECRWLGFRILFNHIQSGSIDIEIPTDEHVQPLFCFVQIMPVLIVIVLAFASTVATLCRP